MKHKFMTVISAAVAAIIIFSGCTADSEMASRNLSKAADQFEVQRHITFYNGITGEYIETIEGRCSITDEGHQLEVTCKVGEGQFVKHFLGLSDNVTYTALQVGSSEADVYHHRVIFKPETVIPDFDFETSMDVENDG